MELNKFKFNDTARSWETPRFAIEALYGMLMGVAQRGYVTLCAQYGDNVSWDTSPHLDTPEAIRKFVEDGWTSGARGGVGWERRWVRSCIGRVIAFDSRLGTHVSLLPPPPPPPPPRRTAANVWVFKKGPGFDQAPKPAPPAPPEEAPEEADAGAAAPVAE